MPKTKLDLKAFVEDKKIFGTEWAITRQPFESRLVLAKLLLEDAKSARQKRRIMTWTNCFLHSNKTLHIDKTRSPKLIRSLVSKKKHVDQLIAIVERSIELGLNQRIPLIRASSPSVAREMWHRYRIRANYIGSVQRRSLADQLPAQDLARKSYCWKIIPKRMRLSLEAHVDVLRSVGVRLYAKDQETILIAHRNKLDKSLHGKTVYVGTNGYLYEIARTRVPVAVPVFRLQCDEVMIAQCVIFTAAILAPRAVFEITCSHGFDQHWIIAPDGTKAVLNGENLILAVGKTDQRLLDHDAVSRHLISDTKSIQNIISKLSYFSNIAA